MKPHETKVLQSQKPSVPTKQSYRPKEAAEYLGVGLSTIWLYITQGKFKTRKLSPKVTVISRSDLDAFLDGESKGGG